MKDVARHVRDRLVVLMFSSADGMAGPILLGMRITESLGSTNDPQYDDWTTLPLHRDESQVRLDVDRSFIYYPPGSSLELN